MTVMETLLTEPVTSSLGKNPELSFAIISPYRTYIFINPNPTSHRCWIELLSQSIIAAHIRRNSRESISSLPVGWRHLVSRTSCYTACITNDLPMLHSTLVKSQANKRDSSGYTPLHYAAMKGNLPCCTYLLDKGSDPNTLCMSKCWSPLFYACHSDSIAAVRLLVANGGDSSSKDVDGNTLCHVVTITGEASGDAIGMLRLLTSNGTDVNEGDNEGTTPLHRAAEMGLPRMVKCLANSGAKPAVRRSKDGLTPLQLACARPFTKTDEELFNVETIRNLLGVGACPNLPVREDARIRGSVYERDNNGKEEGGETHHRRVALDVLLCGQNGRLLVEGNEGEMTVDEVWSYKVFLGVMELIRGGCRYSEEVSRASSEGQEERSDDRILHNTITNNLPLVALLLAPLFASLIAAV